MIISKLQRSFAKFRKDEDGSQSVELVLMVPLLSLITFSMIVWFAAYKAQTHAIRATTVITDMVSRETGSITPSFLAGVDGVMRQIVPTDDAPEFRVTSFTYVEADDEFAVVWSKTNGTMGELDDAGINQVANRLPDMRDQQTAILMETSVDYTPIIDVGLGDQNFQGFSVTAPRFVPRICYEDSEIPNPLTAVCDIN